MRIGSKGDGIQHHELSDMQAYELMALASCRHASDYKDRLPIAQSFVTGLVTLDRLIDVTPEDLFKTFGFEEFESIRFKATIELGRISSRQGSGVKPLASNPSEIWKYLRPIIGKDRQEHFVVLILDTKLRVYRHVDLFKGTLTGAPVGVREVLREAIRDNACAIALAHNHPSGDTTPSPSDIATTRSIIAACKIFEINMVDHVIIGDGDYFSMRVMNVI